MAPFQRLHGVSFFLVGAPVQEAGLKSSKFRDLWHNELQGTMSSKASYTRKTPQVSSLAARLISRSEKVSIEGVTLRLECSVMFLHVQMSSISSFSSHPALTTKDIPVSLPGSRPWFWLSKVLVISYGISDCYYDDVRKGSEAHIMFPCLCCFFPVFVVFCLSMRVGLIWLIWLCGHIDLEFYVNVCQVGMEFFGQVPLWEEISEMLNLTDRETYWHWETRLNVILKNDRARDGGYNRIGIAQDLTHKY